MSLGTNFFRELFKMKKEIENFSEEELKKIIQDEAKKNNLSKEEIKDVENILTAVGGMSKGTKRTLINITGALGVSMLAAAGIYGVIKYRSRSSKDRVVNIETTSSSVYTSGEQHTITPDGRHLSSDGRVMLTEEDPQETEE